MPEATLRLRVGTLNDRHAHVTVYDRGGHAGAIILDRKTWDAIEETGDEVTAAGDYVDVIVQVAAVSEGLGEADASARRSIARGREDD